MWGKSMWMDCKNCNSNILFGDIIRNFSKELVEKIDMIAFGDPQVIYFGSDDKEGYTLVQLIETSNIVAHFSSKSQTMYLDVFSCKDFDPQKVIEVVKKYFGSNVYTNYNFEYKWGINERGMF